MYITLPCFVLFPKLSINKTKSQLFLEQYKKSEYTRLRENSILVTKTYTVADEFYPEDRFSLYIVNRSWFIVQQPTLFFSHCISHISIPWMKQIYSFVQIYLSRHPQFYIIILRSIYSFPLMKNKPLSFRWCISLVTILDWLFSTLTDLRRTKTE